MNDKRRTCAGEEVPDPVTEEMIESFPASDPPGWTTSGLYAGHRRPPARRARATAGPEIEAELSVSPDTVCYLIQQAHDLMGKAASTSDADSDEAQEDESDMADMILEDRPGDAVEAEMRSVIADLDDADRIDLVALMWLGREDDSDWAALRALAEAEDNGRTADYLLGTPLLADYLEAGLQRVGFDCGA